MAIRRPPAYTTSFISQGTEAHIQGIVLESCGGKKIGEINLAVLKVRLMHALPDGAPNFELDISKGDDGYALLKMDFEEPYQNQDGVFTSALGFKFEEPEGDPDPDFMKNLESI